jgi:tetratricopeptide (TPR) repeat protein
LSIAPSSTRCPTDETLALFASGDIDASPRNDVLVHIETCSDCMAAVLSANAHLEEERSVVRDWSGRRARSDSRWWLGAVAAAVIIAVIAFPLLRRRDDPIARLVALAPSSARQVEPRLSGGFAWAPYRGPMRSTDSAADAERLKLGGAAGDALERAQRDHSQEAQRAAAVALMLIDRPADAIDRLHAAAEQSPADTRAWNDLAAARYAAAVQLQRPSLLSEALAAADHALRIDPKSVEALFNRALILERMGLVGDARNAWLRYLEVDSSSSWATEARGHLHELPSATSSSGFDRDRPLLGNATAATYRPRLS